ncbi:glycoside hydrolase family 9 protein [Pseudoxanthomonas sp. UTMC 1351]|uniref:glycoside hydrolase family 9 protein n=1 Tax=Pseudoxanthomonas sp. UTMC 1351 TaxID=2695853 RepID=UPI0034CD062E
MQRGLLTSLLLLCLPLLAHAGDAAVAVIQLNQIGYLPAAHKLAAVPTDADAEARFVVEDAATGEPAFAGELGAAATWPPSNQRVRIADFSALETPGRYRLRIRGLPPSDEFVVGDDAYAALAAASLKAFYFNRASMALEPRYAGRFARAAGHPDNRVRVHASAASEARPEGTLLSAPKGWYDAGDYNKYIVNSGISTWTLLAAWEAFPQVFAAQDLGIPEGGDGAADLLHEAWWNLAWMLDMQDSADGGVYHKLTTLQFAGMVMPADARAPRYVVQKSTAAALNFAAVMAQASRVYAPFDAQFPGASQRMLLAARAAWAWAQSYPQAFYRQPADVATGTYGDDRLDDEFAWAATELYIATGEDAFHDAFAKRRVKAGVASWSSVGGLAWISLAAHRERLTPRASRAEIEREVESAAAALLRQWQGSAYRLAMREEDFVWGSNAMALNQAMLLVEAYRLNGKRDYLDAAQSQLDYVLGRNPLARSYITGFGARPPMHVHHRVSEADGIVDPVPGWLAGGPNPRQQDAKDCSGHPYPSKMPALSYIDAVCSYASNEVAINWNAPLVYVAAALQALTARQGDDP